MTETVLFDLVAVVVGLIVGSYLNVLVHRIPIGKSTILPRSACPWCGGPIRPWDNIPVLSFIHLRGRCRQCSGPISWRYPTVELSTAGLFLLCAHRFPLSLALASAHVFCALMILLAAIDAEHFLLPDSITFPGIAIGLALAPWSATTDLVDAIVGTLVGAGILILVINGWYWLRQEEGMGLGDVNMLALIGAFLGWTGVLTTLFLAIVAGAVTGLALLASRRGGLRSRLPFGVFLAFGGVLSLFFGEAIVALYTGLL